MKKALIALVLGILALLFCVLLQWQILEVKGAVINLSKTKQDQIVPIKLGGTVKPFNIQNFNLGLLKTIIDSQTTSTKK